MSEPIQHIQKPIQRSSRHIRPRWRTSYERWSSYDIYLFQHFTWIRLTDAALHNLQLILQTMFDLIFECTTQIFDIFVESWTGPFAKRKPFVKICFVYLFFCLLCPIKTLPAIHNNFTICFYNLDLIPNPKLLIPYQIADIIAKH